MSTTYLATFGPLGGVETDVEAYPLLRVDPMARDPQATVSMQQAANIADAVIVHGLDTLLHAVGGEWVQESGYTAGTMDPPPYVMLSFFLQAKGKRKVIQQMGKTLDANGKNYISTQLTKWTGLTVDWTKGTIR